MHFREIKPLYIVEADIVKVKKEINILFPIMIVALPEKITKWDHTFPNRQIIALALKIPETSMLVDVAPQSIFIPLVKNLVVARISLPT